MTDQPSLPGYEPDENTLTAIALVRALVSEDWPAAQLLIAGADAECLAVDCAALAAVLARQVDGDVLATLHAAEVEWVHGVRP